MTKGYAACIHSNQPQDLLCETQAIKSHLLKLQNFFFSSQIFSMKVLLSTRRRESKTTTNTSRMICSRTISQLALLCVVGGSEAVSHFPFTLLPLLPNILTREYITSSDRWQKKKKKKGGGRDYNYQGRGRYFRNTVSTANGNKKKKKAVCVIRIWGTTFWGTTKMCSECALEALGAG